MVKSLVDEGLPLVIAVLLFNVVMEGVLAKLWKFSFKIQPSVILFALGMALERCSFATPGRLGTSVAAWARVDPHVILFVLLPPLIFESAFSLNVHVFKKVAFSSMLLAGPGVVLSVALTGGALMGCINFVSESWDWHLALALASVLSATDPVAVVAVLGELNAPTGIRHLIEGESLVNDGTAFSLFLLFHRAVTKESSASLPEDAPLSAVGFCAQLALGGPAVGLFFAWLTQRFARWANLHALSSLTIPAVFSTFLLAEQGAHVSGVLAILAFGLFLTITSADARAQHHHVWSTLATIADALIFAVSGAVVSMKMRKVQTWDKTGTLACNVMLLYVLLHAIRLFVISCCKPFLSTHAYGFHWKHAGLLTFSGLRGAVSLALGLLVSNSVLRCTGSCCAAAAPAAPCEGGLDVRDELMFYISGIVLLTTLINGSLCGAVYKQLRIAPENHFQKPLAQHALEALTGKGHEFIEQLKSNTMGCNTLPALADWDAVRRFAGVLHEEDAGGIFGALLVVSNDSLSAGQREALACMEDRLDRLEGQLRLRRSRGITLDVSALAKSSSPPSRSSTAASDIGTGPGDVPSQLPRDLRAWTSGKVTPPPAQLKLYPKWDEKAKATLTTVLQSMQNTFIAMHDRYEINSDVQHLLLEVVEVGKDVVVGAIQFSAQQSVQQLMEQMEKCLEKQLDQRQGWALSWWRRERWCAARSREELPFDFTDLQRRIHAWSAIAQSLKPVQALFEGSQGPWWRSEPLPPGQCPIVGDTARVCDETVANAQEKLNALHRRHPVQSRAIHTLQALRSVANCWFAMELHKCAAAGFLHDDTHSAMELLVSRLLGMLDAYSYERDPELVQTLQATLRRTLRAAIRAVTFGTRSFPQVPHQAPQRGDDTLNPMRMKSISDAAIAASHSGQDNGYTEETKVPQAALAHLPSKSANSSV
jgi:NhaP-type Na+/H+ or K+/H+ antiporter